MSGWQDWIGRTVTQRDHLTPGLLARFRATIDSDETGDVAPQGFHWCLCLPDAPSADLGEDGHPRRTETSFLPPIPLPRRMWASSRVSFHAPLRVGQSITRTSTIADIVEKQGGTGQLVFVSVDHETQADGAIAISERQMIVYREASLAAPAPEPAETGFDAGGAEWARSLRPSAALLFRYSALTFNSHRIHYDLPYAVEEECYRGLVVHGPLTATLLLDLVARGAGPNRIRQFSYKAEAPAFAGEPLHLVGRVDGQSLKLSAHGGDGRTIASMEGVVE